MERQLQQGRLIFYYHFNSCLVGMDSYLPQLNVNVCYWEFNGTRKIKNRLDAGNRSEYHIDAL
jgi:hypothetical protein